PHLAPPRFPSIPMRLSCLNTRLLAVALGVASALNATAETVAYYRFENGVTGQPFGNALDHSILDSSTNGYHANPSRKSSKLPLCSSDVPETDIPRTGAPNAGSLQLHGNEDVYGTAGQDLARVVFTDFTVELWAKFDSLEGWQTLIGRDDAGSPGEGVGKQSL